MDHWGDPWADNANDKSPTKNAVTSPLPPAFSFKPVPLNGFVDDAGWGNNDDDGFGDWATSPRVGTGNVALNGAEPTPPAGDQAPDSAHWGTSSHQKGDDLDEDSDWPAPALNTVRDFEHVDSEPSDSATVSQLEEILEPGTVEESTRPAQLEVESARSSTSPSETSRNELPIESPRTSIEDERSITKDKVPEDEALPSITESDAVIPDARPGSSLGENEKEPRATEIVDKHIADTTHVADSASTRSDDSSESEAEGQQDTISDVAAATDEDKSRVRTTAFACDEAALAQLFSSSGDSGNEGESHNDPIYSTSARKAWYRLTRKQTMREFNHGDSDDNYIRVTWTNSHVRAEVNKVVGRWAREDRISGTGPGARASFYWDTPAPAEPKAPFGHLRTQSSVPTTKTALPARQSLPPLATNKPAAFDWSSPTSTDPWKLESPAQRSTSSPLTLKNPVVTKIQRQEGRAASVDLTPRRPEQTAHKRTATVSHTVPKTMAVASPISPPLSQPPAGVLDSQASVSGLNTPTTSTIEVPGSTIDDDDDDDWGEMVQTPTLPTPNQLDSFAHASPSTTDGTQPSALIDPIPQKVTPAQAQSRELMFASPSVRLQSTISPTSALFKANNFIPLHAEQGPIGPGLLKPADQNTRPTVEKKLESSEPRPSRKEQVEVTAVVTDDDNRATNDAWTTSESPSADSNFEQVRFTTPVDSISSPIAQPAAPVQATADSWADADFSFFESAPPPTAPQPAPQTQDPSDPLSFFDIPAQRFISSPSKASPRPPPRDFTPPSLQPLTGATSTVQRRKAEEDNMISNILSGLPDLRYMLR